MGKFNKYKSSTECSPPVSPADIGRLHLSETRLLIGPIPALVGVVGWDEDWWDSAVDVRPCGGITKGGNPADAVGLIRGSDGTLTFFGECADRAFEDDFCVETAEGWGVEVI